MLRRTAPVAMLRATPALCYKYTEFEMSKNANNLWYYPREAPNTSYFSASHLWFFMSFGYGREEVWLDRDWRRYETWWEMHRRFFMAICITLFIFPMTGPRFAAMAVYGEYDWHDHMDPKFLRPFDNMFLEDICGETLDPEWVRHIHSKDSY